MTMNSDEARRTIESLNAVGSPVERQVRRLRRKLEKRDEKIAGMKRRIVQRGAALLAASALAAVFVSYLNPHLAVDLANRVWACF